MSSRDQNASFEPPGWRSLRPWALTALLLHVLPFAVRPALIGGDEPHYALAAHSIAIDHDVDLRNDYDEVERGSNAAGRKRAGQALDRHLRPVDGRLVFSHPLGLPLLAAPLVALGQLVEPGAAPDLWLGGLGLLVTFAALVAGWRALSRRLGDARRAALVVAGLYFSTPLWFYSRTFFTEPYTWAFAVLAVACLESRRAGPAALFLGLSLAMKETALLLVAPILVAVLVERGARQAARVAVGPLAVGLGYAIKNLLLFGRPLVPFQPYVLGSPLAGGLGLLVDPARGLLWFAPLAVVASAGWVLAARWRAGLRPSALFASAAVALGYFAVTAAWVDWRGGACYGPRLLVPALPACAAPLLVLVDRRPISRVVRAVLGLAFVGGFTVQWCAALSPVHAFWISSVRELLGASLPTTLAGAGLGVALLVWTAARFPRGTAPAA